MTEQLQIRIYGDDSLPTLIFLPGMHGDWTLIGSFRRALNGRVRFVEFTYPRTLTWSLDDYAAAIEMALMENKITHGWLLGESFGSQLVWPLVGRNCVTDGSPVSFGENDKLAPTMNTRAGRPCHFQIDGVILAGGFVRHPMRWSARLSEKMLGRASLALVTKVIFGYAKIAKFRFRKQPEILAHVDEFVARRTELDKQAATYRLHLVAQNDPREVARLMKLPVYGLTGFIDPIVPWPWVRSWLRQNCPALREYKIIMRADHNVLGTAAKASAEQIVKWIEENRPVT